MITSLLAIAAVVAGLIAASTSGGEGPPDLRTSVAPVGVERSGGVIYELTVENRGGATAENVVVEITVGEESREIEVLSVAKGDEESATVVFPPGTSGAAGAVVLSYHETTRG